MSLILTAKKGTNADLIPDVVKLYIPEGGVVADVTYGKGVFWQQVDVEKFQFFPSDLKDGVDCRHLPHEDESLDALVLDPPYIYNPKGTVKDSISDPYRVNETMDLTTTKKVVEFYIEAMEEGWRCLTVGGVMLVKCQDQIEANKQRWVHIDLYAWAVSRGMVIEDLFVLVQNGVPASRWPVQRHARKNHSFLWVFRKKNSTTERTS